MALLVGLLLAQAVSGQHKDLETAMATGRFAELEARARRMLLASDPHTYPPVLSRLTRALAEQKRCGSTRVTLGGASADQFLLAQLDTAAGDFAAARDTLSAALTPLLGADAGRADPSLADALELLSLLERLCGDERRASALRAQSLELREKPLHADPFDLAVGQLNVAFEKPTTEAWSTAIVALEAIGGAQHALVAVALEKRAVAFEQIGKRARAQRDRARASKIAGSGWCR